jgi:hypothetical protein
MSTPRIVLNVRKGMMRKMIKTERDRAATGARVTGMR